MKIYKVHAVIGRHLTCIIEANSPEAAKADANMQNPIDGGEGWTDESGGLGATYFAIVDGVSESVEEVQPETFEKLVTLKQMVENKPSKREISMIYLNEHDELQRVTLTIEGEEPTEDEWLKLDESAASFHVFEVLSMDGSDGKIIIDGESARKPLSPFAGTVGDVTLLEALKNAEEMRLRGREVGKSA